MTAEKTDFFREGVLLRAYGGFYIVLADGQEWSCSPRGRLKQSRQRLLPGDLVRMQELSAGKGVIEEIFPRKNQLLRPRIANVDQAVLVMACRDPEPDLLLLDRLLLSLALLGIEALICFNKCDLLSGAPPAPLAAYAAVCRTLFVSAETGESVETLRAALQDKTSVFAGQSGVGKSSLLNRLEPAFAREAGAISERLGRGRHTTRYVELLPLSPGALLADSPGFSLLDTPALPAGRLEDFYPEFAAHLGLCRFDSCSHVKEPDCAVKAALAAGGIDPGRYARYCTLYAELKEREGKYE